MTDRVRDALTALNTRYVALYQKKHGCLPVNGELTDWPSPCVVEKNQDAVLWQPELRPEPADFANIEAALELELHDSIKALFGTQFSGDMDCYFKALSLTLIQVWNDEDFKRLQENIIGHLVMQRRLKLDPTVFIGGLSDELKVVSVCNTSGQVLLEKIGTRDRKILSPSLAQFLDSLEPDV